LAAAKTGPHFGTFFEVDARFITLSTLYELFREGKIESAVVQKAIKDLEINLDKPNPLFS
jgi:pyruvate dehydrogenase E1 component